MTGLASAIYEGRLRHRRRSPKAHDFGYPVYMVYLDLAEAEEALGDSWLCSSRGAALFAFRRRDYLGDPALPLDACVRDLVEARLGRRPRGPVRMLGNLACLGTNFNPVVFYYCFAEDGEQLEAVVADIVNTPWGERHAYVLGCAGGGHSRDGLHVFALEKEFHVSPFFRMAQRYSWKFLRPGTRLMVHMENHEAGEKVFDATLILDRRAALSPRALLACQWRHPLIGLRVLARIYFQAARLFAKKIPFVPHPRRATPALAAEAADAGENS